MPGRGRSGSRRPVGNGVRPECDGAVVVDDATGSAVLQAVRESDAVRVGFSADDTAPRTTFGSLAERAAPGDGR